MQVLEKILEEIDVERKKQREVCKDMIDTPGYRLYEKTVEIIKGIIRRHMEGEDTEVPTNGWIPCSERLPEEIPGRYYPEMIVTTSRGDVKWGFYRTIDKEWYVYSELLNKFVEVEAKEVIAWQPLPKQYKPVETKPTKNTQQELEDFWRDK